VVRKGRIGVENKVIRNKTMKKLSVTTSRASALLLCGALAIGGMVLAFTHFADAKEQAKPEVKVVVDQTSLKREMGLTTSFAPVVKKVAPSVVNVFTTIHGKRVVQPDFYGDPFLKRFFGDSFEGSGRTYKTPNQSGLGSGVMVTEDGYILTNNHVVKDADEIKVGLHDGREFVASVVGRDPKTDIAVLKIDASDLPFLVMADSDGIEIGDLVLAVGNPFGLGQTVTMGMVSATGRGNMGIDYEDFIQTDAAINPGNSGGALVDAQGRLIGINTAILSRSGGNNGIGFAVPVNLARYVMTSLVESGRVVRGFLGVMIQNVTAELAREFELAEPVGALVSEVTPGSAAAKGGVKEGDVILELDGRQIRDSRDLKLKVAQTAPGTKVALEILRDGKRKNLEVVLKELPGSGLAASQEHSGVASDEYLSGVTVADLDRSNRQRFDVPEEIDGALVLSVEPDSPAYEAGLRSGDVIREINRKPVKDASTAVELSEKLDDPTILLKIWSKGGHRYLVVDESKAG